MRHPFSRMHRRLVCLAALTTATYGTAAPELRKSVDQKGDFVLFGNTLGWDCNQSASLVLTGTVDCTGTSNTNDSAIDVYWRSQEPGDGQALASPAVTMANARSTAELILPTGATITYARLYWAALQPSGGSVDDTVTIDRPGDLNVLNVTADRTWTAYVTGTTGKFWYQGGADVTDWMALKGSGAFRVDGVSSITDLPTYNDTNVMAGWSVVVFYSLATGPSRNLTLFEGLDSVNNAATQTATISGFLVPAAGFDAKLGVVAYEGDADSTGDSLRFGPNVGGLQILSDALNPANNFFNSTHSYLGAGVQNPGDLPRLTGAAASMGGIDIDVVDVKALVQANQTSATIRAMSSNEHVALATLVTSISTFKPDFSNSGKAVRDVNAGALLPGDTLEYTVTVVNTGSDTSENTVLTDVLPTQVTYVAGSMALVSPVAGPLTDVVDNGDVGSYDSAARTITVNLGTGATSTAGGSMAVGDKIELKFQVTLNVGATGLIENQATIAAKGAQGAPTTNYLTDGNDSADGAQPTSIGVDSDGDGIPDVTELTLGTDPNDADSDDDGVKDGDEPNPGTDPDGDGLINALDPDSDNDGLFDGTEMGLGCGDTATDLTAKRCIADLDPGTITNPLLADSDGGGKSDGSEDANLNGRVDAGETNPTTSHEGDDASLVDSDGDGLSNALEATLGSNPNDKDSDDDGVLDGLEPNPSDDGDHDGLVNVLDSDSDNDGLFDGTELGYDCSDPATDPKTQCIADADPASHTSAVIADTDHGGIRDGSEDYNRNGRLDSDETDPRVGHGSDDTLVDTDLDGLTDALEDALDSDPNDADSDDDGVKDGDEANPAADTDGDGKINVLDEDSDGDGLFDGTEVGNNCSGTGTSANTPPTCIADGDSGATQTSPLNADTDRGGVKDGTEDTNHNGVVDTGERNPNNQSDDSWTCFADSDCDASATSGRVCSDAHACIDGCRGSGGNGCPSGQVCSSTSTTIGSCSTPGGTGGAPGTAGAGGAIIGPDSGGTPAGAGATGTLIATAGTAGARPSSGGAATSNVAGNAGTRVAGGAASVAGSAGRSTSGGTTTFVAGASSTTVAVAGTPGTAAFAGSSGLAESGGTASGGEPASGGSESSGGTLVAAGGADEVGGSAAIGGAAETSGVQTGTPDMGSLEGSGCDCTVAAKTGQSRSWLLTMLVGLLWLRRKRSR